MGPALRGPRVVERCSCGRLGSCGPCCGNPWGQHHQGPPHPWAAGVRAVRTGRSWELRTREAGPAGSQGWAERVPELRHPPSCWRLSVCRSQRRARGERDGSDSLSLGPQSQSRRVGPGFLGGVLCVVPWRAPAPREEAQLRRRPRAVALRKPREGPYLLLSRRPCPRTLDPERGR